jgi:short chain dehydrogenase
VEIEDKVAVVTGAGSGIGRAVARRLAHDGAAVVVADVDEDAGASAVREIHSEGGRAAFVLVAVAAEDDVEKMVAFAEGEFGGLDVLVNNAVALRSPTSRRVSPNSGDASSTSTSAARCWAYTSAFAPCKNGGRRDREHFVHGWDRFPALRRIRVRRGQSRGGASHRFARYPRGTNGSSRQLHLPGLGGYPGLPTQPCRDDTRGARKVGPFRFASAQGDTSKSSTLRGERPCSFPGMHWKE